MPFVILTSLLQVASLQACNTAVASSDVEAVLEPASKAMTTVQKLRPPYAVSPTIHSHDTLLLGCPERHGGPGKGATQRERPQHPETGI
jgi:hypothetical protein